MGKRKNKFEGLTVKVCRQCERELPLDAYYQKSSSLADADRYKTPYARAMGPCIDCRRKYARKRKRDPDVKREARHWNLKRLYGISLEEYEEMSNRQGGVCAVCGEGPRGGSARTKYLHVDHCHTTGEIRGLLCHMCNKGMGGLRDDPVLCRRAAEYLERG